MTSKNETLNDIFNVEQFSTTLLPWNSTIAGCVDGGNDSFTCLTEDDYLALIEEYIFPTPFEWALIVCHILVFIIGLIGNALVILSVYRNQSMRTVTNFFIANLATADFLVILICLPPTVLWDVTETWFFGSAMCKMVLYSQGVSVSVSVLTLTFISVDRWYAICYPLKFKSTTKKARVAIVLIWTISLLIVLPDAIFLNTRKNPSIIIDTHYFTDCAYTWTDNETRMYQLCITLVLFVLPFILMSVAYFQIAKVLWRKTIPGLGTTSRAQTGTHRTKVLTNNAAPRMSNASENSGNLHLDESPGTTVTTQRRISSQQTDTHIRARRKAAKMLIVVVAMFAFCYLPVHLINALRYSVGLPQNEFMTVASLVSHWLCYANSAINPIIYNFMSGRFRQEYRDALKCLGLRHRNWRRSKNKTEREPQTKCENFQLESLKKDNQA